MGWFGKPKRNFENELRDAIKTENISKAGQILLEAFDHYHDKPESFIPMMMIVADTRYASLYGIIDLFVQTFPDVLNPTQVNLAALYAEEGKVGVATELARDFLRKCSDLNILESLSENAIVARVVGWAFLLLSAGYQQAGAKSYSIRILQKSQMFGIAPTMRARNQSEIEMLQKKLLDPNVKDVDAKWELFFKTGEHSTALFTSCNQMGLTELATRVDVLETHMRYGVPVPFEKEYLKKVSDVVDDSGRQSRALV